MSKDLLVGCITAMVMFGTLVTGIVVGVHIDNQAELRFAEICVNNHKGVEYRDIGGNLVSECK
jgi:hypothetical protein